ncbi:hypothetical protein FKM82_016564 [Ascaphus truei]
MTSHRTFVMITHMLLLLSSLGGYLPLRSESEILEFCKNLLCIFSNSFQSSHNFSIVFPITCMKPTTYTVILCEYARKCLSSQSSF